MTKRWESFLSRLTRQEIEAAHKFVSRFRKLFSLRVGAGAAVTPPADAARIDMNEGCPRIITDAATTERKSSMVERQSINSWDPDVNRVSLHVLAVLRHTRRAGAKEFITPRSAIPTNDVDLSIRMSDSGSEIGKNVKDMRIIMLYVACTMVS
jgi:hypothetical protein